MSPKLESRAERDRLLAVGLLALGVAALAALFARVESQEAAPVLGIAWLLDLTLGAACLLLWAAWGWLEPRRRRTASKLEARLTRCRLRHHQRAGALPEDEVHDLEAWIDRREQAALRRPPRSRGKLLK
jgi:hypothetical protein